MIPLNTHSIALVPDVADVLKYARLVECSQCRSWYHNTKLAAFYHSRRCGA